MADVLHHFVRRGVSVVNEQYAQIQPARDDDEPDIKQLTFWGFFILWATFAIYLVVISAVSRCTFQTLRP